MHRGFFLPVKALPPAPNGPGTGGGRCHATYLCGERFNSRPPRGGRLKAWLNRYREAEFQSTPSARRATGAVRGSLCRVQISIHALREEGDQVCYAGRSERHNFNPRPPRGGRRGGTSTHHLCMTISIHALREEGDPPSKEMPFGCRIFQSTPSARRATVPEPAQGRFQQYFNPRHPRGGRPRYLLHPVAVRRISIHALREEGDVPVRLLAAVHHGISIHALREEGDAPQGSGSRPH